MRTDTSHVTVRINGRPVHPLLRPLASVFFLAAAACDLLCSLAALLARPDAPQFAAVTDWLLLAGLALAALSALVALLDYLGDALFRHDEARAFLFGTTLAAALQARNLGLRWDDAGALAPGPMGLGLSLAALVVLLAVPSEHWARLYTPEYRQADPLQD